MFEIRGLLICITFFLVFQFSSCFEGCSMQLGENPPVLIRRFGKKTLIQNGIQNQRNVFLSFNESIQLFCDDHFKINSHYGGCEKIYEKNITVECTKTDSGSKLTFTPSQSTYDNPNIDISCSSSTLQLYESNETLTNCNNFMSYGIGTKSMPENILSPIGICYDLDTLHIKYAKYISNRPKFNFLNPKQIVYPQIIDLDMELNNFEQLFSNSFMRPELFDQLYNNKASENALLRDFKFVYTSLIQEEEIKNQFIGFEKLFNIVWWHGLLEGNWRNFHNVFKAESKNSTYIVYSGVSGSMILPSLEKTEKLSILKLSGEMKSVQTPAYVWSYFQSLENNVTEKFVIVGHNTPFYVANKESDFCKDICNEIDWLKGSLFEKLHLMPIYGVVNCCHPEDVAGKLDNFPLEKNYPLDRENDIFTERTLN